VSSDNILPTPSISNRPSGDPDKSLSTELDREALFLIEFFKESDPKKPLDGFKKFAKDNPLLARRIITENLLLISKKYGYEQAKSLCGLLKDYDNNNLANPTSHYNYEYERLIKTYNREAINKSKNWNYHQWKSFFLDPNRSKEVKIIKNFGIFAGVNQVEARSIIDSLKNTNNLTKQEKEILNRIEKRMRSKAEPASNRDTDVVQSLHADPQALALAAPAPLNQVKDWDRSDWERYFQNPHDSGDLGFAAANFHFFTEKYGQFVARKLLQSTKASKLTTKGRGIRRDLKINPEKQFVQSAINTTKTQSGSQTTNTDSHSTSVEAPAQDTSSWDKSRWKDYFSQLRPADGTNTLKTFVSFARANPESASELLQNVQNGNLSAEQTVVMQSLRGKFLKSSISSGKPTGAQVPAQAHRINSSRTSNTGTVEVSTAQVPQTEAAWRVYFRKLDKTYPDEQFKVDMEAFRLFALRDKPAAVRAAFAIHEKGRRDDNDMQVIAIRNALGIKITPGVVAAPKSSNTPAQPDLSLFINNGSEIKPSPAKATTAQNQPAQDYQANPQNPDTETQLDQAEIEPESAFDETITKLVGDLSVALKRAHTQALDIEDGSPFSAAKLIAIKTMLKNSHSGLTQLTEALKTLEGKVLTDTDKYQLKAIENDFDYFDDAKINDLKAKALANLAAANKKKADATNAQSEAVTPAAALSPPRKEEKSLPKKTAFEIIKGLEDDLKDALKNIMSLEETNISNLETQLNETFKDLADLATNDKFFQSANNDKAKVFLLSSYIILLGKISKLDEISNKNIIGKIFTDQSQANKVRSLLKEYSTIINKSLLQKIEAINHPDDERIIGFIKTALEHDFQF
jgi:hypothetical protein